MAPEVSCVSISVKVPVVAFTFDVPVVEISVTKAEAIITFEEC